MRHRANVPNIAENAIGLRLQNPRQLAVITPSIRNGALVDSSFRSAKTFAFRRHIRLRAIQPHISLTLLLRGVERVRVQKRPHKLPAAVLPPKSEMRVLVNSMVPAVERR